MKTFIRLIVVACFAGAAFAQQPDQSPKPGPEQQKLQMWAGEWTLEGESQTTFLGPGEKVTGKITARFILNGFGLESVSNEQSPSGEKQTVEIDTYDPVTKSYPDSHVSSDGSFFQGSFTVSGSLATWEGTSMVNGQRYKNRGTSTVASDGMSYIDRGEISVDGKTWMPLFTTKFTKVQDSEKSAVEATVRDLEQACQDYNLAKVRSLLTPGARWIEGSLPVKIDDEWQWFDKAKAVGVRITYRVHDFETHVQGDVAWVTETTDGTFAADTSEGQRLLLLSAKEYCSSRETHVSCEIAFAESMVLVKTPSGWKIALGHTSSLPKDQK
jgi:ketosteroid isomerase-like protein